MQAKFFRVGAALAVATLSLQAADLFTWSEGHGDVSVNYTNGQWQWRAEQGKNTADVVIQLNEVTRKEIPALPAFAFLGSSGDPIWIIPSSQMDGIPFVGVSAEETAIGTFVNDRFELLLSSVQGPGHFFMWTTTGTGTPTVAMNSHDGITSDDKAEVPAGGHFHQNWGFTSPGTYRIGFRAAGILNGQTIPVRSDEAVYTVEVGVLKLGEADIEIAGEDLQFHVHDEVTDTELDPAHIALQVGPTTWQLAPENAAFSFLGKAGARVSILPQDEHEGVLFLGLAAGELEKGIFLQDTVMLRLDRVEGPGTVAYYRTDEFGAPRVFFNSADGLSVADVMPIAAGSHAHANWSFSAPGIYHVTLQATGTLVVGGTAVSGPPTTFLFEVLPPQLAEGSGPILRVRQVPGTRQLEMSWDSRPAASFQLQSRLAIGGSAWSNEGSVLTGQPGIQRIEVAIGNDQIKLFRLLESTP